jgi:hypothetical protein
MGVNLDHTATPSKIFCDALILQLKFVSVV